MPQTKMSTNLFGEEQPDPAPPAPGPAKEKKPSQPRIRGVIKKTISDEDYVVQMRESGLSVRRCRKKHVDTKSIDDIIDFVTGQGRLAFGGPVAPPIPESADAELLECAVEFIACHIASSNDPKYQLRYSMAADALRDQVELMAPNQIAKRLGEIVRK